MLAIASSVPAATEKDFSMTMESIATMQEEGWLSDAEAAAKAALESDELSKQQRHALEYEVERTARIRRDYRVTEKSVIERLSDEQRGIADFKPEEIAEWERESRLDYKVIDGEKRYMNSTVGSLFFRYPDLRERRLRKSKSTWQPFLLEHVRDVKRETAAKQTVFGEPRRFEIDFRISVDDDVVSPGETVRCWMPFPQQFAVQQGVELLSSSPTPVWLNRADYPMRSIHFEAPANDDGGAAFKASWTMTTLPRHFEIDPNKVESEPFSDPSASYFAEEKAPHVVFTQELRELEAMIAGDETNPVKKARLYYDWMSNNIKYTYAREYSTLRNISMYVFENGYGDCGQLALMYITLCRIGGIPARWQSGWVIYPQDTNLHDWCEIYIEPYGWIPVDVNYGIFARTIFDSITEAEANELQDFFFGGLDAYRMIVNRDHGFPHYPPKETFRSDDVDFQRGELEAEGRNIYFKDFGYNLDVTFLDDETE